MLVFDIFKQDEQRMRVATATVALGMFVLLAGLWYVQVVCAKKFQTDVKKQSFRHVGIPAVRGRILDCNGNVLADELPRYNAVLYLEELRSQFEAQYSNVCKAYGHDHPALINAKGSLSLSGSLKHQLHLDADCEVVSNISYRVSASLQAPRALDTKAFLRHYKNYPYVPFQIVPALDPREVAVFSEQWLGQASMDLETQPVRSYPYGSVAAHLLGYVQRRDDTNDADTSFTLPDFHGVRGVESYYDKELRGEPGVKVVLVNSRFYRQREYVQTANQPGEDIYLTIDLTLQRAVERALAGSRGAAVVMDPRNGDVLAIASAPTFDPNPFAEGRLTDADMARLNDPKYKPQLNRAVSGAYPPGSTFKIITGLACLESGLDPNEVFDSIGYYQPAGSTTAHRIGDTAGAGPFNFERAFFRSSNTYFIVEGLQKAGIRKILEVARRFHLGEKTGLFSHEGGAAPYIPDPEKAGPELEYSAPDICIGQEITATPLQMAAVISVIANGGTLYWPRVVSRARSSDTGEIQELVSPGRVRDHVEIASSHLAIIRHAMLEDTEYPYDSMGPGGAYDAFHEGSAPRFQNFRVAGKTGTAEVKSPNSPYRKITWFDSYGPYEDPRYVVVVMIEDGASGGKTCAPVAAKIYDAIVKRDQSGAARPARVARN